MDREREKERQRKKERERERDGGQKLVVNVKSCLVALRHPKQISRTDL